MDLLNNIIEPDATTTEAWNRLWDMSKDHQTSRVDLSLPLSLPSSLSLSLSLTCMFLGDSLISWSSKRLPTLFCSSADAEYMGFANVVSESWDLKFAHGITLSYS